MGAQGVFSWMLACVVLLLCIPEAQPVDKNRSYYDILNVEPTATNKQIKKAFRTLAIKYHPDKNKSSDAEKLFREGAEAYEVLSNKEKRRLYDQLGHEAFQQNESSPDPEYEYEPSFSFSFGDMFMNDFDDDDYDDDDLEDPHFHWRSFYQKDEDGPFEHYSFHGFNFCDPMYSFYHIGGDENDNDHD
ncbi:hypothetical protein LDENG_00069600 [Lucifuga dentata]|nr:hypothetical protein LDENG_00069600 [Lucifuga dentata]